MDDAKDDEKAGASQQPEEDAKNGENKCEEASGTGATEVEMASTAENGSPNVEFHDPSQIRKRLRPHRSSSASSSVSGEPEVHREELEIQNADDIIRTSDDDSTSSDDTDTDWANLRLDDGSDASDDVAMGEARPAQEDPTLAWTNTLCQPVNTRSFQTLDWLWRRTIGSHPSKIDGCLKYRKDIQASPWMIGRWKLKHKLNGHEGCVNAVNFNESGSLIASGSDDLHIIVWDWFRKRVVSRFDSGHAANVFQSKFLPYTGDLHIVSCARDGQVRLAQLSTSGDCRNTRRLGFHRGSAHKLSLDPACPHSFYSCGEDSAVFLFDVREDKPKKLFLTKERSSKIALYSIHANPVNENEFLTSGRDQFIRTYDRRFCSAPTGNNSGSDRPANKFCPPHLNRDRTINKHVTCAVYSNDGQYLIGSYNDDDIYLFGINQHDGEDAIRKFRGHRNYATVKGVNFYGPNSEFVVSGSDCGNVFVWETATANVVNVFHADDGGVVNVLEPHPHDPVLATSGLDNDVKIWSPERDNPIQSSDLSERVSKLARKNASNRKTALAEETDGSSIAWILMEAFQRERRRHMRAHMAAEEHADGDEAETESESTDDEESDDNDLDLDSDDDDEESDNGDEDEGTGGTEGQARRGRRSGGRRRPVRIQCAQS